MIIWWCSIWSVFVGFSRENWNWLLFRKVLVETYSFDSFLTNTKGISVESSNFRNSIEVIWLWWFILFNFRRQFQVFTIISSGAQSISSFLEYFVFTHLQKHVILCIVLKYNLFYSWYNCRVPKIKQIKGRMREGSLKVKTPKTSSFSSIYILFNFALN